MLLQFKTLRWQNFLSTGNQWTEIDLAHSPMTLIVGTNGAGKTTIIDALIFALYGRPYRDINKNQLINSITKKGTLVEVEFVSKNRQYLVRRGIKPGVFEIYVDGKMVDQNATVREYQEYLEKNILHLNLKSFTQIVVIGSTNFVPFMQLKTNDRRAVIEDILDIEIFTTMQLLLRARAARNKADVQQSKYDIELTKQRIELLHKHINEMSNRRQASQQSRQRDIDSLEGDNTDLRQEIERLAKDVAHHQSEIDKLQLTAKNAKLARIDKLYSSIEHKVKQVDSDTSFISTNTQCPSCHQDIDDDHRATYLENQAVEREKLTVALEQLATTREELVANIDVATQTQLKIDALQSNINRHQLQIQMNNQTIDSYKREMNSVVEEDRDSSTDLKAAKTELKRLERRHHVLIEERQTIDVAHSLLRDGGIKARIIKQYIPIINQLMNKYLATMDFFVEFELDENFNETIRSRYRDDFSYHSFSEGEKARIDLCLIMVWRSVARLRNSVSTNLMIMDEVFDGSLDLAGSSGLLSILGTMNSSNIFVISHKTDELLDKFPSVIEVVKDRNFSSLERT